MAVRYEVIMVTKGYSSMAGRIHIRYTPVVTMSIRYFRITALNK